MRPDILQNFEHPLFQRFGVQVDLLRLDVIDPLISGNKWFKLQPLLTRAHPKQPVLSFGGAYSNHLHALARFGQQNGIKTIGVVRGEPKQTATLEDAQTWGMRLHFIGRQTYRELRSEHSGLSPELFREMRSKYGDFYILPEGGAAKEAVGGCSQIWSLLPTDYAVDRVLVSVGTGTTLAGLVVGAPENTHIEGVAAIADADYLEKAIGLVLANRRLRSGVSWSLDAGVSLRFAKLDSELAALWQAAFNQGVELDPVYTLRMLYYFIRRLLQGRYAPGERILLVHTGGLQGLRGQRDRLSRLASAHSGPIPL